MQLHPFNFQSQNQCRICSLPILLLLCFYLSSCSSRHVLVKDDAKRIIKLNDSTEITYEFTHYSFDNSYSEILIISDIPNNVDNTMFFAQDELNAYDVDGAYHIALNYNEMDSLRHGVCMGFFHGGILYYNAPFFKGMLNGTAYDYDYYGRLRSRGCYIKDSLIMEEVFIEHMP